VTTTDNRDLVIWGGTGQMRVLNEFVASQGYSIIAIIDRSLTETPLPCSILLRDQADLETWLNRREETSAIYGAVAVGGGNGKDRQTLARTLEERGVTIVSLIHPTAFVAVNSTVARGAQILAHAIVASGASIGSSTIINTGASIDHDCIIGNGSHIGPGAVLAGEVQIGENVFIGAGAVVLPRLAIGDCAVIGAGAVVTRSVDQGAVMIGNPARPRPPRTNPENLQPN
jgi:sugar O-acyltransferase (sialic acid O-acetyltransferase NeuD family)